MTTKDQALLFHAMRLTAAIDGKFGPEEGALVRSLLSTLPDFDEADIEALTAESTKLSKKHGGLIESAEALSELSTDELRRKAFVLATEVAFSSEGVSGIERDLIKMLKAVLAIDNAAAKQIQTVMGWKYQ